MSAYQRFENNKTKEKNDGEAKDTSSREDVRVDMAKTARGSESSEGRGVTFFGDNEAECINAIMDPGGFRNQSLLWKVRIALGRGLEHIFFRLFTVILILVDLTLMIIDLSNPPECVVTDVGNSSGNVTYVPVATYPEGSPLKIVSHTIIAIFLLEVVLRVFAKGRAFFLVILDVIDMVVVVLSFIIDIVNIKYHPEEKCDENETRSPSYLRLVALGRLARIIRILRILYIASQQRRHVSRATRQLVSQNKRRYQKDGFDLDLCYVTERVIAMSFPSKGLMAIYRNPIDEVARFFNTKHKDHYKIFNLCSERCYDETLFDNNVERIFIDDHNVPKAQEMLDFANKTREWMEADPENVIAIHCKGGKGRTGTMICVWLIECGLFEEAKLSLEYFGSRRTDLSKGNTFQGVETPSQSRYVEYFEIMKNEYNHSMPPKNVIQIKSFKIVGIGSVGNGDGSDLYMEIREANKAMFECNLGTETNCKVVKHPEDDSIVIKIQIRPVEGDIKVMFKTNNVKKIPIGYDKCPFYFWFNTRFLEDNELKVTRQELDNPHKPKTHHVFRENFAVIVKFEVEEDSGSDD
ncbi:phosphatidylinositol 3,4,5-trisphosphate 3-phosphatase TPTE2-like isoform X2 [Littorina saxatilis]